MDAWVLSLAQPPAMDPCRPPPGLCASEPRYGLRGGGTDGVVPEACAVLLRAGRPPPHPHPETSETAPSYMRLSCGAPCVYSRKVTGKSPHFLVLPSKLPPLRPALGR